MPGNLDILKQHKNDLLLAEVAAWLHNWDKFNDKKMASDWKKSTVVPRSKVDEWQTRVLDYKAFDSHLASIKIMDRITLKELAKHGSGVDLSHPIWLANYLARCHGAAHIEKELRDTEHIKLSSDFISSPFGAAQHWPEKQYELLQDFQIPDDIIVNRKHVQNQLQGIFKQGWGDNRLPLNEVTLWDWSHIVAALYKAALAGALLQHQKTATLPDPKSLKWRLLALRFDGSRVVDRSPNVQALLARREWVKEGLDKAKRLLEEDYPLGTEVYRDSNGAIFVVPDVRGLLEYTDSGGHTLKFLIQQELDSVFDGELLITPQLDQEAWWAQDPNRSDNDEPPPIAERLGENEPANPDPAKVKDWWQNNNTEPCRISGVRPQGPSSKAVERKLSDFWLKRTGERSKEWAANPKSTIWMSEVADINGRVALVAAKLDLKHWLTPKGLVNTLLATSPQQGGSTPTKKTPSFARLRRIWETCAEFWEGTIEAKEQLASLVGTIGPRLVIQGTLSTSLRPYHAYEILLKTGVNMEVVWDGDEKKQRLIVITNLQYLAGRLGAKPCVCKTPESAADWLKQNYLQDGKELKIYEPEDSGGKPRLAGCIRDIGVELEQHDYLPAISVLSEPQQFMILVPADKAPAVARHIKSEYEVQFSRVKNRLPLHLNLLFFGHKQPLYAAIDAARRMLKRKSPVDATWMVDAAGQAEAAEVCRHSGGRLGNRVISLKLRRKAGDNRLPQLNAELETMVSYSTGDPNTEDVWYPYLFVRRAATDIPLESREHTFNASLPGCNAGAALVHVKEIEEGDDVCYAPSTFDFEFLDVAARRFELVYDEATGMRLPRSHEAYATRPFLLEDLDVMQDLWALAAENELTRRKKAQLQQITGLIEAKRRDWRASRPDDDILSKFAAQVFRRSFGKLWNEIPEIQRKRLTSWAASGRWRDLTELYMSILKLPESATSVKEQEVIL